jgi:hypothetical protein
MSPWLSAHPAVLRFRRIMALSLMIRIAVLIVAADIILHFVKGA